MNLSKLATIHLVMIRGLLVVAFVQMSVSACSSYSNTRLSRIALTPIGYPTPSTCLQFRDCSFTSIYYKVSYAYGGAISYASTASDASLELNSTLFFACHVHTGGVGANAQGGAVYTTCPKVLVFRTCLDNCSSQGSGHALYLVSSANNYQRTILMSTFFKCGLNPIEEPSESTGTVWLAAQGGGASLTVANGNWTANRALKGEGAVFYADVSTTIPSFRYVTCLSNTGDSAFYYSGTSSWPTGRSPLFFEYVNLYRFSSSGWSGSLPAYVHLINAHANFSRCVFFRDSNAPALFNIASYSWAVVVDCVTNEAFTGATVIKTSIGTTATYDPDVPISVCIVPPGTTLFSRSKQLNPTAAFAVSHGWGGTQEMPPSARVGASAEIPNSAALAASDVFARTHELAPSKAGAGSAGMKPSADFTNSMSIDRSEEPGRSQAYRESDGLEKTQPLKGSVAHGATKAFSATSSFTEVNRLYKHGRSLIDLSGYLFFVFFYGDE
jgi:hypothetical protein